MFLFFLNINRPVYLYPLLNYIVSILGCGLHLGTTSSVSEAPVFFYREQQYDVYLYDIHSLYQKIVLVYPYYLNALQCVCLSIRLIMDDCLCWSVCLHCC